MTGCAPSWRSRSMQSPRKPSARPVAPPCRGATAIGERNRSSSPFVSQRTPFEPATAPGLELARATRTPPRRQARATTRCFDGVMALTSPVDRSLLGRIDVLFAARLEEERFHVLGEKAARLWIHQVQAVVVDQHHLLARPLVPAVLTDLAENSRPD